MPPEAKPKVVEDLLDDDHVVDIPDDTPADDPQDIDPEESAAADAEFKKLDNAAFAKMRKEAADARRERDDLRKKMKDLENRAAPTPPPVVVPPRDPNRQREMIGGIVVPETKAEWDALAKADWQTAVDMRSIISARKVQEEATRVATTTKSLNDSKDRVLQRHPELADQNSDKGKIYMKILEKNPDYLSMTKGPILAMRDMEDEMETLGYTKEEIYQTKKAEAQQETERVVRGSLTNGGKMPVKKGRTVTLSKDDMEFCKSQGIKPEDYAREKLALEQPKGAQL